MSNLKLTKELFKKIKNKSFILGISFGLCLGVTFLGLVYEPPRLIHWISIFGSLISAIYFNHVVNKFWKNVKEDLLSE